MIASITTIMPGRSLLFRFLRLQPRQLLSPLLGFLFWPSLLSVLADDQIDYSKQIKPILTKRCVACHGALKQQGGLRLDTAALAIKGGTREPRSFQAMRLPACS